MWKLAFDCYGGQPPNPQPSLRSKSCCSIGLHFVFYRRQLLNSLWIISITGALQSYTIYTGLANQLLPLLARYRHADYLYNGRLKQLVVPEVLIKLAILRHR